MIEKSLAIPDLEVKRLELGKIYSPRSEEANEEGYIYYEDLIYYPEFEKQHVVPRTDVGHEDREGNIIKSVGFLFHDDEVVFDRFKPEFGYKFSLPKIEPSPGGVVDIIHTYGLKDFRTNDFRYTAPAIQHKDIYQFVYLSEKDCYIQVPKKGELRELYQEKKEEGARIKRELSKYLHIYRMEIYNSFFKRKVSNNVVNYELANNLKIFHKPQIREVKEFIKNARVFLEDSHRYVSSLFVLRLVMLFEYETLLAEIKSAFELCNIVNHAIEEITDDEAFDYLVYDWFPGTSKEIKIDALVAKEKAPGPLEQLKSQLLQLLTPRFETLEEIQRRGVSGYFYKDGILIKTIGEFIRSNYLYENAANATTESEIEKYLLERLKK